MALPTTGFTGRLVADPELRYTQNGRPVANFTLAANDRKFDRDSNTWKDEDASFFRATVWGPLAEHVAQSLTKGQEVVALGKFKQTNFETKEGEKRTAIEIEVDAIGPSLQFGTTVYTRAAQGDQGQAAPAQAAPAQAAPAPQAAPVQQAPAPQGAPQYADDTPF